MNKCRLTSPIRLSYLAPDIVRALLEGRQPIELTPTRLLRLSKDLPHDWSEQRGIGGTRGWVGITKVTSDPASARRSHP